MSIKIKNSQLNQETIESLNNLIDLEINATVAFKLSKIIKEVFYIIEDKIKMEKRILDKWYKRDENGNLIMDNDGQSYLITDSDQLSREMESLMNTDNEIPLDKINFDDLQLKTAKVKDLMKLDFLFN